MIYCLIKRITCCVLTHFHRNNFILGRKKGVPKILDEKKKIKNIVNENWILKKKLWRGYSIYRNC